MKTQNSEKGQVLILIAFGIVALIGLTALAIDGGRAFEDKRHAQNAADTAALSGALAYQQSGDITIAATNRATSNGYTHNGTTQLVSVNITDIAAGSGKCPGNAAGKEITVSITSTINTTFARVLGRSDMTSSVTAVTHACGYILYDPFGGAAVAATNPGPGCSFDSGSSNAAHWTLKKGGIFSNGCANSKNNNSVTLDPGECVSTVGTASNFTCSQQYQTNSAIPWPDGVAKMMPENPCDGTPGDVGLPQGSSTIFVNGVYCISDFDALDSENVHLDNATLYITDLDFSLKFAGGGGFSGTPSQSGRYKGYYMIVAFNPSNPCLDFTQHGVQSMVLRGNSGGTFSGTILAPSACLDVRGNGEPSGINTQLVGYNVTSNGNGEVFIQYSPNPDLFDPFEPSVTLIQ